MGMAIVKMVNKKHQQSFVKKKLFPPGPLLKRDFLAVQQVLPQSVKVKPNIYLEESLFTLTVP